MANKKHISIDLVNSINKTIETYLNASGPIVDNISTITIVINSLECLILNYKKEKWPN